MGGTWLATMVLCNGVTSCGFHKNSVIDGALWRYDEILPFNSVAFLERWIKQGISFVWAGGPWICEL